MAVPKHRVTLTRKKLRFSTDKCFCNRSIRLNELSIYNKTKKNDLALLFYVRSTLSPKIKST
jgi:ribosomal protein L32